jgi:uncharacterized Zn finger protein
MTIVTRSRNSWIVPSQTRPDAIYIVVRHGAALTCDCMAGIHRGACRHIAAVTALLPAPAADPAKVEMAKRLGIMA